MKTFFSISLEKIITLFSQARKYRWLLYSLTYRDIVMRFRQSTFSFFWLVLQPLCMLAVYSFVFQAVLRVRWHEVGSTDNNTPTGLILFAGITAYMLLADTLTRTPTVISSNTSYVKKILFPLALLPTVVVASALIFSTISFILIVVISFIVTEHISTMTFFIAIPVLSLACMSLGLGWFVAALGVYFRDISQLMPFVSTVLLFTAPICYPSDMIPEQFSFLMKINPLTIPVETIRALLFGGDIDSLDLVIYFVASIFVMFFGYKFFQRLRTGFSDVL